MAVEKATRYFTETLASKGQNPPGESHRQEPEANCPTHDRLLDSNGRKESLPRRRRLRRKEKTLTGSLCGWIVNHQIGISMSLLTLLTFTHLWFPRARWRTQKFFRLSYYQAPTDKYTQGTDDLYLVGCWITIFTGLRAAAMDYILIPFARRGGIGKKKAQIRFAEQAWLFLYYTVFWSLGVYIMYHTKYWFNLREMWTEFPNREMTGLLKWYYLVQFAFWLQQIVVVNIEERRKDHAQMFTHHIITSVLMLASYGYYQTKVGNVILCVMDVVDLALPAAKMLRYFGYQTACDVVFGIFIFTWFLARHVCFLMVCWSIHADVPKTMPYGCFSSTTGERYSADGGTDIVKHILQPFFDPDGSVCFNPRIRYSFLSLLLALQTITLIWFALILRIAFNVLTGKGADDSRSDEEEGIDDAGLDEVETGQTLDMPPVEKEVDIDEIAWEKRSSPMKVSGKRKAGARTSGISLAGHGNKKELLGRIGCDKPT